MFIRDDATVRFHMPQTGCRLLQGWTDAQRNIRVVAEEYPTAPGHYVRHVSVSRAGARVSPENAHRFAKEAGAWDTLDPSKATAARGGNATHLVLHLPA